MRLQVDEKLAAQQREAQEAAERLRQEQAERLSAAKVSESEAEAALAALSPEERRQRRLQYLMAQSEVFSHFLGADSAAEAGTQGAKKKGGKKSGGGGGGGRTRMAESTEDAALMKGALAAV